VNGIHLSNIQIILVISCQNLKTVDGLRKMFLSPLQPHLSAIVQARRFSRFDHTAPVPDETDAKRMTPSYYVDEDYPARPEIQ